MNPVLRSPKKPRENFMQDCRGALASLTPQANPELLLVPPESSPPHIAFLTGGSASGKTRLLRTQVRETCEQRDWPLFICGSDLEEEWGIDRIADLMATIGNQKQPFVLALEESPFIVPHAEMLGWKIENPWPGELARARLAKEAFQAKDSDPEVELLLFIILRTLRAGGHIIITEDLRDYGRDRALFNRLLFRLAAAKLSLPGAKAPPVSAVHLDKTGGAIGARYLP